MSDRPGKCPACGGVGWIRDGGLIPMFYPCTVCKRGIIWVRFAP